MHGIHKGSRSARCAHWPGSDDHTTTPRPTQVSAQGAPAHSSAAAPSAARVPLGVSGRWVAAGPQQTGAAPSMGGITSSSPRNGHGLGLAWRWEPELVTTEAQAGGHLRPTTVEARLQPWAAAAAELLRGQWVHMVGGRTALLELGALYS